jgi:hypothetical protein
LIEERKTDLFDGFRSEKARPTIIDETASGSVFWPFVGPPFDNFIADFSN